MTAIAAVARQRTLSSQPTISRFKQSMIAFRYTRPVLGDPHRGHV
jgi:hypothetical protein